MMSLRINTALFTAALLIISSILCYATEVPTSEKRIYLVDVTASMEGRGRSKSADIFNTVKENLITSIEHISDPNTEVVIIPFTNRPHTPIRTYCSKRDSLVLMCQELSVLSGDTNIADAWTAGVKQLDSTKINYMFLLTDGLHNSGPSKEVLFQELREWANLSDHGYMYAFYIMLTPNAKELEICKIVDETPNMWLIESMNIDAALIRPERLLPIQKNVSENGTISFPLLCNNRFVNLDDIDVSLSLEDDPYYTVTEIKGRGRSFSFDLTELVSRTNIPIRDTIRMRISHDKEKYPFVFFTPDHYDLIISNMGIRESSVNASGISIWDSPETIKFGKLKFSEPFRGPFALFRRILEPTLKYPPFKWFAPDTTISKSTFSYTFNEDAIRSRATIHWEIVDTSDFRQNALLSNIDTVVVAKASSLEHIVKMGVRPNTPKTDFFGYIYAEATELDKINQKSLENGQTEVFCWRMKYRRPWPIVLWSLWVLCTLVIAYLLIKGIHITYVLLFGLSKRLKGSNRSWSKTRLKNNNQIINRKRRYLIIEYIGKKYRRAKTIHHRSQWLFRLMVALENLKKRNPNASEEAFKQLPVSIQCDLDKLWDVTNSRSNGPCNEVVVRNIPFYTIFSYPTNNGSSSAGVNKVFKMYNDLFKSMHCRPIKNEIKYRYGRIDMSSIAIAKVRIRYEDTNCGRYVTSGDEGVQTLACKELARNRKFMRRIAALGYDIVNCTGAEAVNNFRCAFADNRRNVPFKREGTPLVWHEDPDCETVYLVPDLIHSKHRHYGGIKMAEIIKDSDTFNDGYSFKTD